MENNSFDDYINPSSLNKFESMLKTNHVLFFDSDEFENIIHYYLEQGKFELAKKAIKLGLNQHPTSINLKLFKVEILAFENKFPEANLLLNVLYEQDPQNEEIYIQKANILSKQDKHHEAINVLKIVLDFAENISEIYSLIGMEYLFIDQFQDAKDYFIRCLELNAQDYSALYNIVYCFDFLDQTSQAINYLNRYLDKNPYSEVAWHQIGKQYFTIKDYDKALASFEFAIISDDTFIGAYLEKAKVLEKLTQYTEAIEYYKITLTLDDPTAFALLRIGHCYNNLNLTEFALQYFYKAVEEDPMLDKAWIAITSFYKKNKDYQKALYYINKAINIDNENVVYWKLYARINEHLNFLEEAERGYKRTLELGNYELKTWLKRSDILIKLGEYEAAIFNLEQSKEFFPKSKAIEYRLAGLYFLRNDSKKGLFHLDLGLQLNSKFSFILDDLFPTLKNNETIRSHLKKHHERTH